MLERHEVSHEERAAGLRRSCLRRVGPTVANNWLPSQETVCSALGPIKFMESFLAVILS